MITASAQYLRVIWAGDDLCESAVDQYSDTAPPDDFKVIAIEPQRLEDSDVCHSAWSTTCQCSSDLRTCVVSLYYIMLLLRFWS